MSVLTRYPAARRDDVRETFFGVEVADPYRWMEDLDSPEVAAWIAAQNARTHEYLDAVPARGALERRYRRLLDHERFQIPFRAGPRWFYFHNSGLQNQPVLYVRDGEEGEARVFLDPNTLSDDGTVALGGIAFTESGRYLAYATQEAGSDWQTWHVRDVERNADLPDQVRWSKFSGASWVGDEGFFYAGYEPPAGGKLLESLHNQRVFFHRIGAPQDTDELVYERPDHPDWYFGTEVTSDQRYAFLYAQQGTDPNNRIYVRDLRSGETEWRDVFPLGDAHYEIVDNDGPIVYVLTTLGAERGRIVAVDLFDREQPLREVVAESTENLESARMIGTRFFAGYLQDARSVVRFFERDGTFAGEVPLPGIGSAGVPFGKRDDRSHYFTFTSYTSPEVVYHYDAMTNAVRVHAAPQIDFDPSPYLTEQLFATSRDGTRVPIFVTRRRDLKLDGTAPCLLYAYGGFNIPLTPAFARSTALWLEMGGTYAVANLRGGGEYGRSWHEGGMLDRKQNVFDDFIAAAEHLIAARYTAPRRLAIQGGSNGGLLMGAMLAQRPELFGAVLCEVGVLDMLRYQHFTAGNGWVPEYGSAQASQAEFETLFAYSPYHNIEEGVAYPATMISTGDHDDRVYPAHSFKFAAALQRAQAGSAPILLRVDLRAGHGAGKPLQKVIDDVCDQYAFLIAALGLSPDLEGRLGEDPQSPLHLKTGGV